MPWIRIIKPLSELETLSTREKVTDEELANQQFRCPKRNEHAAQINFTPVSAFQLFTDKVPQKFFTGYNPAFKEKFGLVVHRTTPPRNVIFRDSQREELSDNIFKEPKTEDEFNSSLEYHNFIKTTEKEAIKKIKDSWKELSRQHEQYKEECKEDGLEEPDNARLNWTEGVFRHKFSDIDGIFIQKNITSIRNGYAFAKVVEEVTDKRTDFYMWNDNRSELIEIDRQRIRDVLEFESKEPNGQKIIIDDTTQDKVNEYKSCLSQLQRGGR